MLLFFHHRHQSFDRGVLYLAEKRADRTIEVDDHENDRAEAENDDGGRETTASAMETGAKAKHQAR